MDKRLPLALFLSFVVWFGWMALNPRPETAPERSVETSVAEPAEEPPEVKEPDPVAAVGPLRVAEEEVRTELVLGRPGEPGYALAVFTNRGAQLLDYRLGSYHDDVDLGREQRADSEHWARVLTPVETEGVLSGSLVLQASSSSAGLVNVPLEKALWVPAVLEEDGAPRGMEYTYAPGTGVRFVKRIVRVPGTYRLALELEIENLGNPELAGRRQFVIVPAACVPRSSRDNFYVEPKAVAVARKANDDLVIHQVERKDGAYDDLEGPLKLGDREPLYLGAHNKYFAVLMREAGDREQETIVGARYRREHDAEYLRENPDDKGKGLRLVAAEADVTLQVPAVGETAAWRYEVYAGPKQREIIVADFEPHRRLLKKDLGYFNGIATLLTGVLDFFHGITGNWGWAIILLTLTVRLILFPVNRRSQTAMSRYQTKMKRLQPRIDEVKKRWEKDPQRQRQEQAKIMQEEGAFPPLGGCLPIFVQIPVFIGLFSALRVNFDLRHAPFHGWVRDLSMPDHLMRIDVSLPLIGTIEYLNILPPLMVVFWILQQRAMPKPADAQAARMQKMMMWMPVMMGFLLYNYAAGLSLYMITQSLLGLVETRVIKKVWPIDETEQPKKKAGFMARLAEAQKQHMKRAEETQRRGSKGASRGKGRGKGGKRPQGKRGVRA